MWVARDEDGIIALYRKKPRRVIMNWFDRHILRKKNCWRGSLLVYLSKDRFEYLKWEDEPISVYVGIYDRKNLEKLFQLYGVHDDTEVQKWINDVLDNEK